MSCSSMFQDAFAEFEVSEDRKTRSVGTQCDMDKKFFAVVDMHWFRNDHNEFIVKEFAIFNQNSNYALLHFKSPYPKSTLCEKMFREATWLEKHYHKISWESGDRDFSDNLIVDYLKPYDYIYTKGREKADFIRKYHDDVREIPENFAKPDFSKPSCCVDICSIHKKIRNGRCALVSASHYLNLLTSSNQDVKLTQEVDYTCENNRMRSMRDCSFYGRISKRNFARQGFYYDGNMKKILCVYCNYDLDSHHVRICNVNSGGGGGGGKAIIDFSVLIPVYK